MAGRQGYVAAAVVLFLCVILLGETVAGAKPGALDLAIESALALRQGVDPDWLIRFWKAVSWVDGGAQRYIVTLVLAIILFMRDRWQLAAALVIAMLASGQVSDLLKDVYERPRPDLVPHLDHVSSLSFPSGHATSGALIAILFAALVPTAHRGRWLAAGFGVALLTGWSRVALGVHWPSDVLGGWLLGGAFVLFARAVVRPRDQG